MVATATSNVSGIERESAMSKASLDPEILLRATAARILDAIISVVISNAPETRPSSSGNLVKSKDAPT